MTFDEMQLILQSVVISQRETQSLVEANTRAIENNNRLVESNSRAIENHNRLIESNERLIESNARAIQAMLDQAATDRLNHEARMEKLENLSEGLINISTSIDEDRPTILRKLNTIEQKADSILSHLSRNPS